MRILSRLSTKSAWARLFIVILIAAQVALCAAPVQAAPRQGPATQELTVVHVVRLGETLYSIAQHYGTTIEAIALANHIADPRWIQVGQRLTIPSSRTTPSPQPTTYTVQRSDTLSLIARRRHTTVQAIAELNCIINPDLIYVGQRLVIPGSAPSAPLPSPFVAVELRPLPVVQGQTLAIEVQTDESVDLTGSLNNRPLAFVREDNRYWALVGIGATAQIGPHLLELTATDDTGKTTGASALVQVIAGDFVTEQIVLSSETSKLLDPALIRAENERLSQVFGTFSRRQLWEGLFRVPLQGPLRVTSAFGTRRSYSGGPPTSYHGGIDYGAEAGTPVLAAGRGRVALAEELTVRGGAVIIDHGLGVYSGYYHLSEITVEAGQEVERGDPIGKVGSTGLSTGSHLHWEIRVSGVYVDSLQWTRQVFP
ncbi:MAG: LysM peptidoglycan-binding domain-containing M23 family metallopeptidase [Anaerolineales bacterium]|nr:LysM peptidoglycan-binding domain-containing M23 family metallopeptidase [Anaerolineales bacterium]